MAEQIGAGRGRSLTWLWMLLAVVVVAGFLTWLGMASEPSSVAVVESEETEEDGDVNGAFTAVPKDSLAADKARYSGQVIRVPEVTATGNLGPAVFWGELGTPEQQVPLLVQMDSALVAGGFEVESGSDYVVTGLVQAMTDSVATAWLESGVLPDEDAHMQATFADYFIEASDLRPSTGGGSNDADDESAEDAA